MSESNEEEIIFSQPRIFLDDRFSEISQKIDLCENFHHDKARQFIQIGVQKRVNMLYESYCFVCEYLPRERQKPLAAKEITFAEMYLNLIYINITGIFDSLAWAIIWEASPDKAKTIRPTEIGLFYEKFQKNYMNESLRKRLEYKDPRDKEFDYRKWSEDIKENRDPAAHRIPLNIPIFLSTSEIEKREELFGKQAKIRDKGQLEHIIRKNDLAELNQIGQEIDTIGSFGGGFINQLPDKDLANNKFQPFYPTIHNDINTVIKLIDIILMENTGGID